MQKETGRVVSQKKIAEDIFDLRIRTSAAKDARPGQFLMVFTGDESRLLGRPISICEADAKKGELRLVYRQMGAGTRALAALAEGGCVELLGPLGNGFPVKDFLAAISVGINKDNEPILDLCYEEDSTAMVDMNVVMTGFGKFVEVQGTGEGRPFDHQELTSLLALGEKGCRELVSYEKDILGGQLVWLVGREG